MSYKGAFGQKLGSNKSSHDILCDAKKKITLSTFRRDNQMFQKLNLDRFFPKKSLLQDRHFNTCAVVSSAGSLKGSGLGSFIDTHEIVLRFNNAPTDKHAKDVGKKTSIRIVNSQVVAKPQFKFLESKFYSSSAVLVWDPSGYNATLLTCFTARLPVVTLELAPVHHCLASTTHSFTSLNTSLR